MDQYQKAGNCKNGGEGAVKMHVLTGVERRRKHQLCMSEQQRKEQQQRDAERKREERRRKSQEQKRQEAERKRKERQRRSEEERRYDAERNRKKRLRKSEQKREQEAERKRKERLSWSEKQRQQEIERKKKERLGWFEEQRQQEGQRKEQYREDQTEVINKYEAHFDQTREELIEGLRRCEQIERSRNENRNNRNEQLAGGGGGGGGEDGAGEDAAGGGGGDGGRGGGDGGGGDGGDGGDGDGGGADGGDEDGGGETGGEYDSGLGDTYFRHLGINPMVALQLFYINSGFLRFQRDKEYDANCDGQDIDVENLKREIRAEALTEDQLAKVLQKFFQCHSYTQGDMPGCSACGIKLIENFGEPEIVYEEVLLQDAKCGPLRYDEDETNVLQADMDNPVMTVRIPVDEEWNTEEVELWKCRSVYIQQGNRRTPVFWHLHPELVSFTPGPNSSPKIKLCPLCSCSLVKGKRPPLSISAGVDFGYYRRIKGLVMPSMFEQMVLQRYRLFFATVKVSSNTRGVVNSNSRCQLKCHAILFPHDAPNVASYMHNGDIFGEHGMLDLEALKGMLSFYFLDDKGNVDRLFEKIAGTSSLCTRSFVLAQWLIVLQRNNPYYKDLLLGNLENVIGIVQQLQRHMKLHTTVITDTDQVKRDQHLGGDIAEAQNIYIGTDAEEKARIEEAKKQEEETEANFSDDNDTPLSCSYVTASTESYLAENKEDFRMRGLANLADLNDQGIKDILDNNDDGVPAQLFNPESMDEYLRRFPMGQSCSSRRESNPFNEFSGDPDTILATCFPHIFMLGKAYNRHPGRLNQEQRTHMMNQFTAVPARCNLLLTVLYDSMMRIEVADAVKAYTEGNHVAVKEIRQLLESPDERAKLKKAVDFPYCASAKKLINKYMRHLRFAGKDIPYSSVSGKQLKHRVFGDVKRFGPASFFLTLSLTVNDNPRSLRLSMDIPNNDSFPAKFVRGGEHGSDGVQFMQSLRNATAAEGIITLPKSWRAKQAIDNPVAYVQEEKDLIYAIVSILLGSTVEGKGYYSKLSGRSCRRTRYYRTRKGIVGFSLCSSGAPELHQKGTWHFHLNFTSGLTPYVMQRFSCLSEVCDEISKVLDKMFCSELPTPVRAFANKKLVLKKMGDLWNIPRGMLSDTHFVSPLVGRANQFDQIQNGSYAACSPYNIRKEVESQAGRQQYHSHQAPVCSAGKRGIEGCRLDYPMECIENTCCVQLEPKPKNQEQGENRDAEEGTAGGELEEIQEGPSQQRDRDSSCDSNATYRILQVPLSEEEVAHQSKYHLKPVLHEPKRKSVIVWESKRPLSDCGPFQEALNTVGDIREHVLQSFRIAFRENVPLHNDTAPFWNWIETEATEEMLVKVYNEMQAKLPMSNGYVAAFCPLLSYATGSHNNVCVLGSVDQALSALFYIIPYECKQKFPLLDSLTIFSETIRHIANYPSNASDSGSAIRTVKYYLTRSINRMNLLIEVSLWHCAGKVLGLPAEWHSDPYTYGDPRALASLVDQVKIGDTQDDILTRFEALIDALQGSAVRRTVANHSLFSDPEHDNSTPPVRTILNHLQQLYHHGCLQLIIGFLCEDPANNPEPTDMLRGFREDILPILIADPFLYFSQLRNDPFLSKIILCAFRAHHQSEYVPIHYESVGEGLGRIRKIKINLTRPGHQPSLTDPPKSVLVPEVSLYYFRGVHLQNLTYYEYLATVEFKNAKPRRTGVDPRRCDQQRHFRLSRSFIGKYDCYHVLRFKQCTPLAVGSPPRHPGIEPPKEGDADYDEITYGKWKKRADVFARYYLSYFRPFSVRNTNLRFDWETLAQYIATLQNDTRIMSRFRLMILDQHINGMTVSPDCREASREYRARSRDLWTLHEKNLHSTERANRNRSRNVAFNDYGEEDILHPLNADRRNNMHKQLLYDDKQILALTRLSADVHHQEENQQGRRPQTDNSQWMSLMWTQQLHDLQVKVNLMGEWKPVATNAAQSTYGGSLAPSTNTNLRGSLESKIAAVRNKLEDPANPHHHQQLQLFDAIAKHIMGRPQENNVPFPKRIMLHGGAGMGKTTLRDAIFELYDIRGRFVLGAAFNNSNAAEMGRGRTVSSYIGAEPSKHMHRVGTFRAELIKELREDQGYTTQSLVFLEEFETTAPWHVARFSKLTSEVTGQEHYFGGADVIFGGDMNQLGPVQAGMTFAQAIMDRYLAPDLRPNLSKKKGAKLQQPSIDRDVYEDSNRNNYDHPNTIGCDILTSFRWYELSEQKRSQDPVHTRLVRKLYRGEKISMQHLKNDGYSLLSREDLTSGEWHEATVLVATNRERYSLIHERAITFAQATDTPVLRWATNYKPERWVNPPPPSFQSVARDNDPAFWEYFVKGAKGYLDEKYNGPLNLVKGMPIKYHSLVFERETELTAQQIISQAPPGEVTTLPFVPLMVIAEIILPEHTPAIVKNALRRFSLDQDEDRIRSNTQKILVPISHTTCRWTKSEIPIRGGEGFEPSLIKLQAVFPLQPAFAMTIHKSLGQTLDKVILALSFNNAKGCNISYTQLYVALTRVKRRADLRLLLVGMNEAEQWASLTYIDRLEADPATQFFFAGFRPYNESNPNAGWMTNTWDANRANTVFRGRIERGELHL